MDAPDPPARRPGGAEERPDALPARHVAAETRYAGRPPRRLSEYAALLAARLGKLEEAARLQEEAVKVFQAAALPGAVADARQRLRYYRTAVELAGSN